jgi:hypothetical protein
MSSTIRRVPWSDNPLDALLLQLAERATSARARAWAGRLLERGEAATGGTFTTTPKPARSGGLLRIATPRADPGKTGR